MEPLWNGVGMPQRTGVSLSVLHTWQAQEAVGRELLAGIPARLITSIFGKPEPMCSRDERLGVY